MSRNIFSNPRSMRHLYGALAIALVGCGCANSADPVTSGPTEKSQLTGGSAKPPMKFEEYAAKMTEIVNAENDGMRKIGMGSSPIQGLLELHNDALAKMQDLSPPPEAKAVQAEMVSQMTTMKDMLASAAESEKKNGRAAMSRLMVTMGPKKASMDSRMRKVLTESGFDPDAFFAPTSKLIKVGSEAGSTKTSGANPPSPESGKN